MLKDYSVAVRSDLAGKIGEILLRMAVLTQTEGKARINISNQRDKNPSKPGEWLHKGTGHGQAGLLYEPTTPAAAASGGYVRVGWTANVFYMPLWGDVRRSRKGLLELVEELKPQLAKLGASL